MQLELAIIDRFNALAHYIAGGLSQLPGGGHFRGAWIANRARTEIIGDELVCTFPNDVGDAVIAFRNIAPVKILASRVEPPIVKNERIESVTLDSWDNGSSQPITETEKWSIEITRTETNDISSELEVGIQETLGASFEGFKAEVQAHINAKLGIKHGESVTTHTIHERNQQITIPAKKSVSITQEKKTTDFTQKIGMDCELGANMRVNGGWELTFDSLHEFGLWIVGGGGGSGNADELNAFVATRKVTNFELSAIYMTTERIRQYNDVATSRATITEVDCE